MAQAALYQISLVAAFVAGMVALFAPCCISYLLPAYFANVFKEKKRVMLMTLVYSAGIFVVMLPVVLGARAVSQLLFRWHDQVYLLGGAVMILVALLALLGIKTPMPKKIAGLHANGTDVVSSFTLGLIAGITSSCCAPVLVGVITLSSLSPTILQSLGVGIAYVLGMVTPLYLAAALIDKGNMLEKPFFHRRLLVLRLGRHHWPVYVANTLAAGAFLVVGLITIWLTLTGNLAMSMGDMAAVKSINQLALKLTQATSNLPGLDVLFVIVSLYLLYKFMQRAKTTNNN